MKPSRKPFAGRMILGLAVVFASLFITLDISAASTIAGFIYDTTRNPVSDIDIELQDEFYRMIARAKSDGAGRYEFNGLPDANYTVKVYAFRYDYQDQSQYVEVKSINALPNQPGSSYVPVDFYLQPKKGGLRDLQLGVIFAQDVPKEAEKAYKKALDELASKKSDEGLASLQEAIKIYPNYYYAIYRLANELLGRKQYLDAAMAFIKSAEINPKNALSFYYAGYALHKAGPQYNKSALTALGHALTLAPNSAPVLFQLGVVERATGKLADAEKHLLQAKRLSPSKVPEVQKELAQLYANDLKKYKEAADELEQYVKASKLSSADEAKTRQLIADLRVKAQKQAAN
jgi:tetratricopeptide (TPR) repeat protein